MSRRLLICSLRKLRKEVYRCFDYEFEDVIGELEGADFIFPEARQNSLFWSNLAESLSRKTMSFRWNPAFRFPEIDDCYDCFAAVVMFAYDLDILARMPDWRPKVGYSICYIDELFVRSLEQYPGSLKALERFDLLVLNCSGTREDLSRLSSVATTVVSSGIDAIRFCPRVPVPERKIDLLSLGRRDEKFHTEFLRLEREENWLYLYDTAGPSDVKKHEDHRVALASRLQRSTFFVVNPAKFDCRNDSGDQEEIGFRYFEGSAAGAVLIGKIPKNPHYKDHFPWEDAVIELPDRPRDAAEFLGDLRRDVERLQKITFENVKGSLERHDFVYRWEQILRAAGIDPLPAVDERKGELHSIRQKWIAAH